MTESEIRSNISYNKNLISEYTAEIKELESELDELEGLLTKFTKLQGDFEDRQDERKSALSKWSSKAISNTIFTSYCSGMKSLLTGSSFTSADSGLSTGIKKIKREISDISQEIDTLESKLSYRKQRKAYWEKKLKEYLAAQAAAG